MKINHNNRRHDTIQRAFIIESQDFKSTVINSLYNITNVANLGPKFLSPIK